MTPRRLVRGAVLIALTYIPVGAILLFVRFQSFAKPQAFAEPLRDRGPEWYSSSIAILGLGLWTVAALAALLGALAARGVETLAPYRRFLLQAAAVSVMLGADDALQLHDPRTLGLPTALVLAVESVIVLAVVISNRRVLLEADLGLLVVTLCFGALWILAKGGPGIPMRTAAESGAKFAAVSGWSVYLVRAALRTRCRARASRPISHDAPVDRTARVELTTSG